MEEGKRRARRSKTKIEDRKKKKEERRKKEERKKKERKKKGNGRKKLERERVGFSLRRLNSHSLGQSPPFTEGAGAPVQQAHVDVPTHNPHAVFFRSTNPCPTQLIFIPGLSARPYSTPVAGSVLETSGRGPPHK